MTPPYQRLLLRLPRLRVFPKRRRSAQTPEHLVPFEMNSPGKLIPVGKDNYTPVVLNFFGDLGTTVSFALSSDNLELFAYGMVPIVPGDPYTASQLGINNPRGGITTLYVQAKYPDAVIADSVIMATMSLQGNGATPAAYDLGTAFDVVVSWANGTGANGATLSPNPNGGGQRVFPEQETPDPSSLKNVVNAVFETVPPNLGYEVKGYYQLLDPDNFIGLGNNGDAADAWKGNDNYWVTPSGIFTVTIPGSGIKKIPFPILQAHAGDNWIVVSSASQARVAQTEMDDSSETNRYNVVTTAANGDNKPANKSDLLTVWRTLNVECDVMEYFNFVFGDPLGNPYDITVPPDPADYLGGFVAEQLARACVVTKVYTPNSNPLAPRKYIEMSDADAREVTKTRVKAGSSPSVWELDPTNTTSGRDIYGNSPEFWTVRIVMASTYNSYGFFRPGANTIVLLYETLKSGYSGADINTSIQRTLLHEIGHVLIDGSHQSGGVMASGLKKSDRLLPQYCEFLVDDIKKLQEFSRARN